MSTNREELHRLADQLPEDVAGKVVRFARAELAQDDADLDAIAKSAAARARLNEKLQTGLDELARGESLDGETVFAELLGEG